MTPGDMIFRVAAVRGIRVADITGPRRWSAFTRARHEAMWLLRESTEMSYPEIGRMFGGRDHSSVIHAIKRIQRATEQRPVYREELLALVRPARSERIAHANVSCSGCIPGVSREHHTAETARAA